MKRVENSQITWEILSTYRSQIMGVAIIWIMLLHGKELFPQVLEGVPVLRFIVDRGMIGVEMFLLVSGIGLFFSLSKNGDILKFYTKRIYRVVIPYFAMSFPFWIWQDIWVKRDIGKFFLDISLLSFWKEGTYTVWYVALIIPIYIVYPLVFRLFMKESTGLKKSTFMAVGLAMPFLIYAVSPSYFKITEIALWRISSFILGNILAELVMKKSKIKDVHVLLLGGVMVLFIAVAFALNYIMGFPGVVRLIYLPLGLVCCFCTGLTLKFANSNGLNRFLGAAGKYSLELYLIHIFLRAIYRHYVPNLEGIPAFQGIIAWCIIMGLSVLLSVLVHKGLGKLKLMKRPSADERLFAEG